MGHPEISERHERPVGPGINRGQQQVAEGANGLDAADESQKNARHGGSPAASFNRSFQAALERGGAVQAQVNEDGDGSDDAGEENCSGGAGRGFEFGGQIARVRMQTKEEQAHAGDHGDAAHIENAFEDVNAKSVGDGQILFFGEKQRPYRLAGAAQEKNCGESRESEGINFPEMGRADVALKNLPAE